MYASTTEKGMCNGAPDVCKTTVPPPVGQAPIPYVNVVNCPLATDAATKVYCSGMPALTKKSKYNTSNGDEAGAIGGVASGKNMGKVEYQMGSVKVKIQGTEAVRMTSPTTHNDNNIVGAQLVPSQVKVMIMT